MRVVPSFIEKLVRGWAEMGAKNHMVEKKNLTLFIDLGKVSESQRILAEKIPNKMTIIVRLLWKEGMTRL